MDYSKSGGPKGSKDSHYAQDLSRRGAPKAQGSKEDAKAQMLARMKAAAEARKAEQN